MENLHIDITADAKGALSELAAFESGITKSAQALAELQVSLSNSKGGLGEQEKNLAASTVAIDEYAKALANIDNSKLQKSIEIEYEKPENIDVSKSISMTDSLIPLQTLQGVRQEMFANLQALETYKNLGMDVSLQLRESWGGYLEWLKENYATDSLEYQQAVEFKKQADDIYYEESKRKLIKHSSLTSAAYNGLSAGFESSFREMIKIQTNSNNVIIKGFTVMANTFIKEIERMAAKWLAFQMLKSVLSPLGLVGFASGGLVGTSAIKRAGGGAVYGSGTSTSDSIPAFLSNGEYVINAAATGSNLSLLNSINAGANPLEEKLDVLIMLMSELTQKENRVVISADQVVAGASPLLVNELSEVGKQMRAEV